LRLPGRLVAAHAGRVLGHPGYGEPDRVRAVLQEAEDRTGRHVSFDHVLPEESRVAGLRSIRHAVFCSEGVEIRIFFEFDVRSEVS
jgi:hypothetical protein